MKSRLVMAARRTSKFQNWSHLTNGDMAEILPIRRIPLSNPSIYNSFFNNYKISYWKRNSIIGNGSQKCIPIWGIYREGMCQCLYMRSKRQKQNIVRHIWVFSKLVSLKGNRTGRWWRSTWLTLMEIKTYVLWMLRI